MLQKIVQTLKKLINKKNSQKQQGIPRQKTDVFNTILCSRKLYDDDYVFDDITEMKYLRATRARSEEKRHHEELDQLLFKKKKSFSEKLFEFIDESGKRDVQVYKAARIDRKHFSKIRCNDNYVPKKMTIIALAIALELSLKETQSLLASAGYTLSFSDETDIIIGYMIKQGIYSIDCINQMLIDYGKKEISI